MGKTWDSIDRYVVISSDTHAGADIEGYKPYLAKEFHDDFDAWAATYKSPYDDLVDATAARNWDSDLRLKELESEGIAAEVILPNTVPPFLNTIQGFASQPNSIDEYRRRWAGLQAHNRWLADFCAAAPGRRVGIAQILPMKLDEALAEIQWAAETPHIGGILVPHPPANHPFLPPLFDSYYDPIWAALQDADLAFVQHTGTGHPEYPADHFATGAALWFEFAMWAQRSFTHLLIGAVFERFPRLKHVITESGGPSWQAGVAQMLDFSANMGGRTAPLFFTDDFRKQFSMDGMGYLKRNVYIATFGETDNRHMIGVDHCMWGSDYPHEEGTQPFSRQRIQSQFWQVPVDETRQILGGAAAKVYGFDLNALVEVAERIGPSLEEVHQEPAEAVAPAGLDGISMS